MSEQPIDWSHLDVYTAGDPVLERELLDLFVATAPDYIARMNAAPHDKSWREAAHGLKGASSAIGARPLAALAGAAERVVPAGAARRETLQRLESVLAEVRRSIANRR
jgi:HPt (histidine-containing phosphotransfer) domain-containing protein